jgi:hypothetical protein
VSAGDVLRQIAHDVGDPRVWAAVIEHAVALLIIAFAAWAVVAVLTSAIRRAGRRPGRPVTLAPLAESAVRYAVGFAALMLMLEAVHVNVTAILESAGIVSLAFGFGAQYVIRDVLAGLFLLSEGLVQIGDLVRLDADTGTVERITLRTMQIRKFNGELLTVPNGPLSGGPRPGAGSAARRGPGVGGRPSRRRPRRALGRRRGRHEGHRDHGAAVRAGPGGPAVGGGGRDAAARARSPRGTGNKNGHTRFCYNMIEP